MLKHPKCDDYVGIADDQGDNALDLASFSGHIEVVKELLQCDPKYKALLKCDDPSNVPNSNTSDDLCAKKIADEKKEEVKRRRIIARAKRQAEQDDDED